MRSAVRSDLLERQLKRYCPRFQGAVRTLAAQHVRLADLALSFPTLLFALAAPRRGLDVACAIGHAIEGAPLAQVAVAADVPLWLRRLPPEALSHAVPPLPDSKAFRRRIVNHLPSVKEAPVWFQAVSEMADLADEAAVVWIAKEIIRDRKSVKLKQLRLVGLWAWFSERPDTFGHSLIEKCWTQNVRFRPAVDAANDWQTTIDLHVNLGRATITDLWLPPARICGYDFRPLASASEIAEEAAAMSNCLRNYGDDVAHNHSRLWSLRKEGQRIATLSIGFNRPLPHILELKGPENAEAPLEVWWAAQQWLNLHDLSHARPERPGWHSVPLDRATWLSLWRPYWLAKRRLPEWLPLAPSRSALWAL